MRVQLLSTFTAEAVVGHLNQVMDWGVLAMNAPKAWERTRGKGIRVAILDTGVDTYHPDLRPNLKLGINFTNQNLADYQDVKGHGSHCAGVIAGCDNDIGVVGIAPEAFIFPVKVLGDDGSGSLTALLRGLRWCIDNQMDVVSLSLGVHERPPQALHNLIIEATSKNIAIVVAAGNENRGVSYPAAYPETIAVGAMDVQKNRASFSNYGAELDIVAPGVDIYSTVPKGMYAKMSGTSMAAPMVVGAIALWISNKRLSGEKYTVQDIHEALRKSGEDIGAEGYDADTGFGMLDVSKFLNL